MFTVVHIKVLFELLDTLNTENRVKSVFDGGFVLNHVAQHFSTKLKKFDKFLFCIHILNIQKFF